MLGRGSGSGSGGGGGGGGGERGRCFELDVIRMYEVAVAGGMAADECRLTCRKGMVMAWLYAGWVLLLLRDGRKLSRNRVRGCS